MARVLPLVSGIGLVMLGATGYGDSGMTPEVYIMAAGLVALPIFLWDSAPTFERKDWADEMCLNKGLSINCAKFLRAYIDEPGPAAIFELELALDNALGLFPEARRALSEAQSAQGPADPLASVYDAIAGVYRVPTHIIVPEGDVMRQPDGTLTFFDGMTYLPMPEPQRGVFPLG